MSAPVKTGRIPLLHGKCSVLPQQLPVKGVLHYRFMQDMSLLSWISLEAGRKKGGYDPEKIELKAAVAAKLTIRSSKRLKITPKTRFFNRPLLISI
jgi:hypothetical protein